MHQEQVEPMPRLIALECLEFHSYLLQALSQMLLKALRWTTSKDWLAPILQLISAGLIYRATAFRGNPLPGLELEGGILYQGQKPAGRGILLKLLLLEFCAVGLKYFGFRKVLSVLGLASLMQLIATGRFASWKVWLAGLELKQNKGTKRSFDLSIIQIKLTYDAVESLAEAALPFIAQIVRSKRVKNLFLYGGSLFAGFSQEQVLECALCGCEAMAMGRELQCGHWSCYYCLARREASQCPSCGKPIAPITG